MGSELYFIPEKELLVTSGGLYSGDPTGSVGLNKISYPLSFLHRAEKPKSQSLILSFLSIRIFSGLISLCAIPFECKYSTPFNT